MAFFEVLCPFNVIGSNHSAVRVHSSAASHVRVPLDENFKPSHVSLFLFVNFTNLNSEAGSVVDIRAGGSNGKSWLEHITQAVE